jgi:hypothetical protein
LTCTRELPPWELDIILTTSDEVRVWEPTWNPIIGVSSVDFLADVRNLVGGTGAAVSLKPAIQYAAVRTDRPGAGAAITAGSAITAGNTLTHYEETLSGSLNFWWRRGWSYQLTSGAFARCSTIQYTSFRSCGKIFPAREVLFNPTNDKNTDCEYPLTGMFPAVGVDKAKLAIVGLDNLNNSLRYRLIGRAFNDPQARGSWILLPTVGGSYTTPGTGDFVDNTGEVDLSGLPLTTNQWMELGLAIGKANDTDPNGRCIFHIIPAIKYL